MKLTIAWNVWNNYQDVLLGSEITRLQNSDAGLFDSLHLISQGGYPEPPSLRESRYLDAYFHISINEELDWLKSHIKYKGVYRVLNGIRHAYQYARRNGCDYAMITNGDAWCLDLRKLERLLSDDAVKRSAVSARIGLVTGLDLSWGSYVPFFDDHFIILNIPLCEQHGVFEYDEPKAYRAHFADFGGIHYMLGALFDERVPLGLFHSYTHEENCVNHFGEKCGYSFLPWQYQPEYSFLHANCAQEPNLHPLRAAMLRFKGLDQYPEVAAYCRSFPSNPHEFGKTAEYVYYRQTLMEHAKINLLWWPRKTYYRALRHLRYKRYTRVKRTHLPAADPFKYYDLYRNVIPQALASRRRPQRTDQVT